MTLPRWSSSASASISQLCKTGAVWNHSYSLWGGEEWLFWFKAEATLASPFVGTILWGYS